MLRIGRRAANAIEAEPWLDFLPESARESSFYYAIPAGRFQLCGPSSEDARNRRRCGETNRRAKPSRLANRPSPSIGGEVRQADKEADRQRRGSRRHVISRRMIASGLKRVLIEERKAKPDIRLLRRRIPY
ncbi:hypothetical protein CDO73_10330 [Saccharibacillus sp. O23]|nr:hypothetical protein CDO73_10330 [Saccharibacillus sp. O23]